VKSIFNIPSNWCLPIPLLQFSFAQDRPLQDHIATLVGFFKQHASAKGSPEVQATCFEIGACYMTAACWRKMWRRISSWESQGFIYLLAKMQPKAIRGQVKPEAKKATKEDRQSNVFMYQCLKHIGSSVIGHMLEKLTDPVDGKPVDAKIDKLMAALEDFSKSGSDSKLSAYNVDTCVEFHHLLVALLLAYGRALGDRQTVETMDYRKGKPEENIDEGMVDAEGQKKLDTEERKEQGEPEQVFPGENVAPNPSQVSTNPQSSESDWMDKKSIMVDILDYTKLLWRVVSSQMFLDHIETIETLISTPDREKLMEYLEWACFNDNLIEKMRTRKSRTEKIMADRQVHDDKGGGMHGDKGGGGESGLVVDDAVLNETVENEGNEGPSLRRSGSVSTISIQNLDRDDDGGAENDDDTAGDRDVGEELSKEADGDRSPMCGRFLRWSMLNISHIKGLDRLSLMANLPDIDIRLLTMKLPHHQGEKLNWNTYIKDLSTEMLSGSEEQTGDAESFAKKAISQLQTAIRDRTVACASNFGPGPCPNGVQLQEGEVSPTLSIPHCEMVLASAVGYAGSISGPIIVTDKSLRDILLVKYNVK
jgi:hypothetical protein